MIAPSTDADYIGFIPCTIISIIGFVIMQKTDPIKARADVIAYEEFEREVEAERLAKLQQAYYLVYNEDNGGGSNGKMGGFVDAMINLNANRNFQAYNATLSPLSLPLT
ncbi:UNVERIFIED_CONTAM: hypothetical protein HDU68_006322, partial [Siphonaria sp. JEL0065]